MKGQLFTHTHTLTHAHTHTRTHTHTHAHTHTDTAPAPPPKELRGLMRPTEGGIPAEPTPEPRQLRQERAARQAAQLLLLSQSNPAGELLKRDGWLRAACHA